jgi:hypothetical protein
VLSSLFSDIANMAIRVSKSLLGCAIAATLLTACGGGGGGGGGNSSPSAGGAAAPQNSGNSTSSGPTPTLLQAMPYLKASNISSDSGDSFGWTLAVSGDGNTLAVGAPFEDSAANTINGDQTSNTSRDSGAVYIYVKSSSGSWTLEAYLKAPNNAAGANFGESVALSNDGSTLVVGAPFEDGAATTVGGDQAQQTAHDAGAVYVFTRANSHSWSAPTYVKPSHNYADAYFGWSVAVSGDGSTVVAGAPGDSNSSSTVFTHSAGSSGAAYVFQHNGDNNWAERYLKASNAETQDSFGSSVALSSDGKVLAVGAPYESSNGAPADNSRTNSGAAYVFSASTSWGQQAYLKASAIAAQDNFGTALALDSTGTTLAVGAPYESSSAANAGAAYVFSRTNANWSSPLRIAAQNADKNDDFGMALALSGDGQTLVVGAIGESSKATGVNGDPSDNSMEGVGAAYLFKPNSANSSWEQIKYLKPTTATVGDEFGSAIGLSSDATTLVISGAFEPSNGTSQTDTSAADAGAAWAFY